VHPVHTDELLGKQCSLFDNQIDIVTWKAKLTPMQLWILSVSAFEAEAAVDEVAKTLFVGIIKMRNISQEDLRVALHGILWFPPICDAMLKTLSIELHPSLSIRRFQSAPCSRT
jgi:hypothetical protein